MAVADQVKKIIVDQLGVDGIVRRQHAEHRRMFEHLRGGELRRLDGGDVLMVGEHFFIGLSERTNQAGAEQ